MKEYKLTEKEINGETHYFASFTDGQGQGQTIEIDKEVYEALNDSQKSVHSQIRQDRRYGLLSFDENIGEPGMIYECERTDDLIQKVLEHMGNLTEVQRRRLSLYYGKNMTLKQIAKKEGVTCPSVRESIQVALSLLRAKKYF